MRFEAKREDGEEFLIDNEDKTHYPMEYAVAEDVVVLLNKLTEEKPPVTIEDYFNEWERNINELTEKAKELTTLKDSYNQLEQDILEKTNFKELYGANNQKVRDNHVKNELKDLVDNKHDLELRIDYLRRRNEFLKSLMAMQRTFIECDAV